MSEELQPCEFCGVPWFATRYDKDGENLLPGATLPVLDWSEDRDCCQSCADRLLAGMEAAAPAVAAFVPPDDGSIAIGDYICGLCAERRNSYVDHAAGGPRSCEEWPSILAVYLPDSSREALVCRACCVVLDAFGNYETAADWPDPVVTRPAPPSPRVEAKRKAARRAQRKARRRSR